jgi:hypothetical protein
MYDVSAQFGVGTAIQPLKYDNIDQSDIDNCTAITACPLILRKF